MPNDCLWRDLGVVGDDSIFIDRSLAPPIFPQNIAHLSYLPVRLNPHLREAEEAPLDRGIEGSCKTIQHWMVKFGS